MSADVKKDYSCANKAELSFPGKEEGHEISVQANKKDQEITCSLAPKQLLKGDGKTELEFTLQN